MSEIVGRVEGPPVLVGPGRKVSVVLGPPLLDVGHESFAVVGIHAPSKRFEFEDLLPPPFTFSHGGGPARQVDVCATEPGSRIGEDAVDNGGRR